MKLNLRNILAILVLAVLVIFVVLKGIIYYKFKNTVDTTSAQMRIFATLQYDSISSSILDSSVTLNKVTILPTGFEDGVRIDALTFQTPDIGYLLKGFNSRRGEFPERLNVSMKGFKIDLYGSMVDRFEQMLNQLGGMMKGITSSTCGTKLYLGPAEYRDMGYDILTSNLDFGYKFTAEGINVTFDWLTKNMGTAIMVMKMTGPATPSARAMMNTPPQLTELSFAYQDLSYVKRSNEYCAKQSGQSIASSFR